VTLSLLLLSVATAVAVGWLTRSRLLAILVPIELRRVEAHARELAGSLDRYRTRAIELTRGLAALPDARDALAPGARSAGERVTEAFLGQLEARDWLLQLRLIAPDGMERIRVERSSGSKEARAIAPEGLQGKGDRGYIQVGLQLEAGEVHVSPVEPNQEFGQVERPIVPVFRTVAPVIQGGRRIGLLVANVDLRPLVEHLQSSLHASSRVALVDGRGDYVYNPEEPGREFAIAAPNGGAGPAATWAEDLGLDLAALPDTGAISRMVEGRDLGLAIAPTGLTPGVRVVETAAGAEIRSVVAGVERTSLFIALAAAAAAILVAMAVSGSLLKPLRRLQHAVSLVNSDKELAPLVPKHGEFKGLGEAFLAMGDRVRARTVELERQVAERERINQELERRQELERTYLAVVESSADAVITIGIDDRITSWNAAAAELFGYPASEVVGQTIDLLIPPDKAPEAAELRARVLGGERIASVETERLHRSGRRVEIALSMSPVRSRSGDVVGMAKIGRDISERRDEEQRFRLVVELSPSGVCMVGLDGRIVLVNQEMEAMFGYPRSELVGMSVDQLVPPGAREAHAGHRAGYQRAPTGRPMGGGRDLYGRRKDGSEFAVEVALNPINVRGVAHTLCLVADITARRQDQQRMADYAARLERSNAELEHFAYVVSHDIKAPLRGIATVAEWLGQDFGDVVDDDARENIDLMRERVERLAKLIDGILDYSRAGRAGGEPVRIDVEQLLGDVVASIEPPPGVAIEVAGPFPDVYYEPTQLRQVFQNLIVNAAAHGGGRLRRIRVAARALPDGVAFRVSDDGVGIAERHFKRIFDLFQTLRAKDETRSAGAGLAIVKRIVESNRGRIDVASRESQGTTFTFTVPADRVASPREADDPAEVT